MTNRESLDEIANLGEAAFNKPHLPASDTLNAEERITVLEGKVEYLVRQLHMFMGHKHEVPPILVDAVGAPFIQGHNSG